MSSEPTEKIIDIPPEILRDYSTPPELKRALANTEQTTPCGMPYTVVWTGGPKKGLPITAYCAEPLCIRPGREPGQCTGPRFVPHPQQYTNSDPNDPLRRRRVPDAQECIEAAIQCGAKATKITRVRDDRTRKEIGRHIGMTWSRMRAAVTGGGQWGT
jgi:hypothetical protein